MNLTPRAQATLRNLIICRQTQIDGRLVTASGSNRRMLNDEQESLLKLWEEIEVFTEDLPDADLADSADTQSESPAKKTKKRPGRPKKQPADE